MSALYDVPFEISEKANFTCIEEPGLYKTTCPSLMGCYYDESLGDVNGTATCHCGSVAMFSNKQFPECSGASLQPILLALLTCTIASTCIGWGIWAAVALKKIKELTFNPITEALLLTMTGAAFILMDQILEVVLVMITAEDSSYELFYTVIHPICLAGMGGCIVLSDLKIPLLWLSIATSSMSKTEAAASKAKMEKGVKITSLVFIIPFLGLIIVTGNNAVGGMYSILFLVIMVVTFQVGSRRLAAKLAKPGEPPIKTVITMKAFVRNFTICIFAYLFSIISFISNNTPNDSDPRNWSIFASAIYLCLIGACGANMLYIRSSLEKKLNRVKVGQAPNSSIGKSSVQSSAD
jgi:hypothetical protein